MRRLVFGQVLRRRQVREGALLHLRPVRAGTEHGPPVKRGTGHRWVGREARQRRRKLATDHRPAPKAHHRRRLI